MKATDLVGTYRTAADRLYRSSHVLRAFEDENNGLDFREWVARRIGSAVPEIVKAHDVRRLCVCTYCDLIGSDRRMVRVGGNYFHGLCAYAALGPAEFLKLQRSDLEQITIGEVGPVIAGLIVDRLTVSK